MKKSGFTLVELLVTLVIMALLFGIGVPAYLMISKNLKQRSYDNKVSYALAKAEAWANDTGRDVTNIAHLIEEGYMEPDNENGAYDSPIDNSSMLCYTIRIKYENNQYSSYLTEERYCDYAELEKQTSIIEIVKMDDTNHQVIPDEAWTRNNVLLRVQFKNETDRNKYQNSVQEIVWNGNNHEETIAIQQNFSSKNQYAVQAAQFMNTRYEATVKIVYEGRTFIYKAYSQVKIDRQNPIIYQDDISVDHFDEWTNKEKGVHLITSDYDGSGVYGYYISNTNTSCSTNKNAYKKTTSEAFDLALLQGEYYACVMDNVGNVSDTAKITILKTDNNPPRLGDFYIVNSAKGSTYYRELVLGIQLFDEESGPSLLRYCITTGSDCTPNNIVKVDSNGHVKMPYVNANQKPQKVCVIGMDRAGNESGKKCSSAYPFDNTAPSKATLSVKKENHKYVLVFGGNDAESGMYQYKLYLGTSDNNMSEVLSSVTTNLTGKYTFENLSANTNYYVKLVVTNGSGMTKEQKFNFKAIFDVADAEYFCDTSSTYCNKGIYIQYSGKLFVLYRGTANSSFGIALTDVADPYTGSIITGTCCDQKHCSFKYVNSTTFGGIYGDGRMGNWKDDKIYWGGRTLKNYYDKFSSPTIYLNQETYTFGTIELANPKEWKIYGSDINQVNYKQDVKKNTIARYGLLDLNEYKNIYNKSYMAGVDTLLSTVYPYCYVDNDKAVYDNPDDSNDTPFHHICKNDKKTIMAVYAQGRNLTYVPAVGTVLYDNVTYRKAGITVPFKHEKLLDGGIGTRENPYILGPQ